MESVLFPAIVALAASLLTFFSGFGLGTLLTPVFLFFYPLEVAIGLTAAVHFLNNVFKFALMRKHMQWLVLLKFGIPAFIGAGLGAWSLGRLVGFDRTFEFVLLSFSFQTSLVQVTVGSMILLFALFELIPALKKVQFSGNSLVAGGALSGFFGGLSGHQGALRSAFLVKLFLDKKKFVSTGIAIALIVDITRLPIYFGQGNSSYISSEWLVLSTTIFAALIGAVLGRLLLQKTTIQFLQVMVGWLMVIVGAGLILGLF